MPVKIIHKSTLSLLETEINDWLEKHKDKITIISFVNISRAFNSIAILINYDLRDSRMKIDDS